MLQWVPNEIDPVIKVYCSKLEERISTINTGGRNYSNLSVEELEALRNLKSSRDIIIKEADKGSAVVVWDKKDYCREAYNHLDDAVVYEKLQQDSLSRVSDQVKEALKPLLDKGYISGKNVEYLVASRPRLGRFYLLPEIHKRLENVPGRPVISNCGTATERISEFLNFHIQPLVEGVPSVIKDSTHFLQRLEDLGHIPSTAILCTMDVVGLYPHIPHSEGLEAFRLAFNKAEGNIPVDDLYIYIYIYMWLRGCCIL